ncbi:hypothetical protein [uncultured Phascolarctobacterium sp.]|uniref:hypothetical protein n=1 Tax=uncultured Phascolarctobacterium sp. TaxID=512296 RepID=UPI0025F81802|nr:hypothetical protein [uncultured Phascolarctobacterium sp.]
MRSHELAPIFSTAVTMLFISSMLAVVIFAFIVIIFLHLPSSTPASTPAAHPDIPAGSNLYNYGITKNTYRKETYKCQK